jgi:hypothetical protein
MTEIENGLNDNQKAIAKVLLDIAIKLSANGIGSISVFNIGKKVKYEDLFEKDVEPFNIVDYPRRFEIVSGVDGACIINKDGKLISYSAQIKNTKVYKGFGCRHSAAYTASLNDNLVIMTSEEDRKVRVFRNGLLIMQIDPTDKEVKNKTKEAVTLMETIGVGTVGAGAISTIGATLLLPTLGITLIPGIILFGSSHYILKNIVNLIIDKTNTKEPKNG